MKNQNLLLIMVLAISTIAVHAQNAEQNFKKLNWLSGIWQRTDVKPGQTAEESWKISATNELTGTGITKQGDKIIFKEKLQLLIKDNQIYYIADVTTSKQPTWFKLTQLTDTVFVCENPDHDFPKKIVYQLSGNKLLATISGNGKSIDFNFVKKL